MGGCVQQQPNHLITLGRRRSYSSVIEGRKMLPSLDAGGQHFPRTSRCFYDFGGKGLFFSALG